MPSSPAPTRTKPPTAHEPSPPPSPHGGGTLLLGVVLIGAGALWLLAALGIDLPVAVVTPALLIVLGVVVLVSAARGWDHAAIGVAVVVGVWVGIAALVTSAVDVPLSGAFGDRQHTPTTVAEAGEAQRLFAGTQVLDLRSLDTAGDVVEVESSTVLGAVEVLVPEGMAVRVDATAAAGAITLFDETIDGIGLDRQVEHGDWATAPRRVDLAVRVGLGEVVVRER